LTKSVCLVSLNGFFFIFIFLFHYSLNIFINNCTLFYYTIWKLLLSFYIEVNIRLCLFSVWLLFSNFKFILSFFIIFFTRCISVVEYNLFFFLFLIIYRLFLQNFLLTVFIAFIFK
jgi:hypothetical protein